MTGQVDLSIVLPQQIINQRTTVPGHFAERHFAERHFAERTFCRRTLSRTDILSNGQYDERTFCRNDNLPKIEKF